VSDTEHATRLAELIGQVSLRRTDSLVAELKGNLSRSPRVGQPAAVYGGSGAGFEPATAEAAPLKTVAPVAVKTRALTVHRESRREPPGPAPQCEGNRPAARKSACSITTHPRQTMMSAAPDSSTAAPPRCLTISKVGTIRTGGVRAKVRCPSMAPRPLPATAPRRPGWCIASRGPNGAPRRTSGDGFRALCSARPRRALSPTPGSSPSPPLAA
jgi:hypothetical protein